MMSYNSHSLQGTLSAIISGDSIFEFLKDLPDEKMFLRHAGLYFIPKQYEIKDIACFSSEFGYGFTDFDLILNRAMISDTAVFYTTFKTFCSYLYNPKKPNRTCFLQKFKQGIFYRIPFYQIFSILQDCYNESQRTVGAENIDWYYAV
jgi:hypothetical protein